MPSSRPPALNPKRLAAGNGGALWPLLASAVLVVLVLQAARVIYGFASLSAASSPPAPSSNPSAPFPSRRLNIPLQSHNLVFGTTGASHTLILFTDPACRPCHQQINRQLSGRAGNLRIVIKYWPHDPANLTGGLLLELARRHGLARAYWLAISRQSTTGTSYTDEQLFAPLESQGLNLAALRAELEKTSPELVNIVGQDLEQGRVLGLPPPPVFILDGMLLATPAQQAVLQRF